MTGWRAVVDARTVRMCDSPIPLADHLMRGMERGRALCVAWHPHGRGFAATWHAGNDSKRTMVRLVHCQHIEDSDAAIKCTLVPSRGIDPAAYSTCGRLVALLCWPDCGDAAAVVLSAMESSFGQELLRVNAVDAAACALSPAGRYLLLLTQVDALMSLQADSSSTLHLIPIPPVVGLSAQPAPQGHISITSDFPPLGHELWQLTHTGTHEPAYMLSGGYSTGNAARFSPRVGEGAVLATNRHCLAVMWSQWRRADAQRPRPAALVADELQPADMFRSLFRRRLQAFA